MNEANTITRTQISLVPLSYIESSGTWMQSTNAQIHSTSAPTHRRPKPKKNGPNIRSYPSTAGSTSFATSSSISRSSYSSWFRKIRWTPASA